MDSQPNMNGDHDLVSEGHDRDTERSDQSSATRNLEPRRPRVRPYWRRWKSFQSVERHACEIEKWQLRGRKAMTTVALAIGKELAAARLKLAHHKDAFKRVQVAACS